MLSDNLTTICFSTSCVQANHLVPALPLNIAATNFFAVSNNVMYHTFLSSQRLAVRISYGGPNVVQGVEMLVAAVNKIC